MTPPRYIPSNTLTQSPTSNIPTKTPTINPTKSEPVGCKQPSEHYERITVNGHLLNLRTYEMLQVAAIILGLAEKTTPATLRQAIDAGGLEPYMNKLPIKAGDHVCVPAGMLHAILEGAVIAEIQQNSNTTYRVYDWNRVGADGNPRPLHIDKALDVIDFNQVGLTLPVPHRIEENEHWARERLCQNKYFTTERFLMNAGAKYTGNCDGSTLEIWGVIQGKAKVSGETMEAIRFVLLPAGMGGFRINVPVDSVLLRTYVA